MKVNAANSLSDFPQILSSEQKRCDEIYEKRLAEHKFMERWCFAVITFFSVVAGGSIILCFFQHDWVIPCLVTALCALFFVGFAAQWLNRLDFKAPTDKKLFIQNEIEKKFGATLEIFNAFENHNVRRVKFIGTTREGDILFSVFFNNSSSGFSEMDTITEKKLTYKVKLTSDSSYLNRIEIDFVNQTVTKYYTQDIVTNVFYKIEEQEAFDFENNCIL